MFLRLMFRAHKPLVVVLGIVDDLQGIPWTNWGFPCTQGFCQEACPVDAIVEGGSI